MKIVDKKKKDIEDTSDIKSKFLSVGNKNLNINCNILIDDFYLDSFNYFPISTDFNSFFDLFKWGENNKYQKFYTKNFSDNFKNNISNFKTLSNVFVLGSSSVDNYYRNMLTFLPRLFFINSKKIKIVLHRSSSNKFRNFIKSLCQNMDIDVQFVFLDNNFYKFTSSQIPQFLPKADSIKILNTLKFKSLRKKEKIYLCRQNCVNRNLINETDIIHELRKFDFRIVDLNNLSILEQIQLFSNAEVVVSPTGSSLMNIAFCQAGTKIYEISPRYNDKYEDYFKFRYRKISQYLNLEYIRVDADPVKIDKVDKKFERLIHSQALSKSNYYKNLLLKVDVVKKMLNH